MNIFSLIKNFFMCFSCKNKLPNTVLVIFPGLGFLPTDYDVILPRKMSKIYLNIWTEEELYTIKKGVGLKDSQSYKKWFDKIVSKSRHILFSELKKYKHTLPKTIFFSHSIGSLIANEIQEYADILISYGGIIKPSHIKLLNLLGTEDNITMNEYEIWPKGAKPILNAYHLSCITTKSKQRNLKLNKELGINQIIEREHSDDKISVIKREIEYFIYLNIINNSC